METWGGRGREAPLGTSGSPMDLFSQGESRRFGRSKLLYSSTLESGFIKIKVPDGIKDGGVRSETETSS